MAWKDEAFDLWRQWATLYKDSDESSKLIRKIEKSWFLINVVDNNFKNEYDIFDMLDAVKDRDIGH